MATMGDPKVAVKDFKERPSQAKKNAMARESAEEWKKKKKELLQDISVQLLLRELQIETLPLQEKIKKLEGELQGFSDIQHALCQDCAVKHPNKATKRIEELVDRVHAHEDRFDKLDKEITETFGETPNDEQAYVLKNKIAKIIEDKKKEIKRL